MSDFLGIAQLNNVLKILIFKILNFLKLCLIFVGSVHNCGKSDDDKN